MASSAADTLSSAELSSLLSDKISLGQSLLQTLSSPELQAVSGVTKLEKKIRQELKFLQRFSGSAGVKKLKKEHLQCSNLQNLSAIVQTLRDTKGPVSVLRPFPLLVGDAADEKKVTVDVVGESGARWVKVVARSPKALDLNSSGGNQFGQKSFLDQVAEFAACAAQNKQLFRAPTVVFAFHNGVSQRLADKIRRRGVVVEGEVIPNEEGSIEESSDSEYESDDNEEEDEVLQDGLLCARATEEQGSNPIPADCDTTRLNLDITAMIAYVSALTNGHADHHFTEPILAEQAAWERERPVKPVLDRLFGSKKLICCEPAMRDFEKILSTLGGDGERERAKELLQRIEVVPDVTSPRLANLFMCRKIKDRSRAIFGTGDALRVVTVSANSGFVRAARGQGLELAVELHESRALTEGKMTKNED